MTAAALLVVLGAALLMQLSGLSMALGAFLAGVLLSELTFRYQIQVDRTLPQLITRLIFLGVACLWTCSGQAKLATHCQWCNCVDVDQSTDDYVVARL